MSPNRRAILTRCVAGRVLIPVPRRWGGLPGLPGEVGALLRREALYAAHLTKWRQRAEQGRLNALPDAPVDPRRKYPPSPPKGL